MMTEIKTLLFLILKKEQVSSIKILCIKEHRLIIILMVSLTIKIHKAFKTYKALAHECDRLINTKKTK